MKFKFREKLGRPENPYLTRWVFDFWLFSVRLHKWTDSDDTRNPHCHEWDFITLVLWGSYIDVSESGYDYLKAGSIRFRHAEHRHYVVLNSKTCWSLLITGRTRRVWGFWVKGKFRKRNKYFHEWGHH